MRKLLLSVLLCSALVMGLLPAAAFATELGNTPESVEEAPTPVLEEQTVNEELLSEDTMRGEKRCCPALSAPFAYFRLRGTSAVSTPYSPVVSAFGSRFGSGRMAAQK